MFGDYKSLEPHTLTAVSAGNEYRQFMSQFSYTIKEHDNYTVYILNALKKQHL